MCVAWEHPLFGLAQFRFELRVSGSMEPLRASCDEREHEVTASHGISKHF